jgi:hypothetical protein
MLYHFEDSFDEMPTLDWQEVKDKDFKTEIMKNGVPFEARLFMQGESWKLKLSNKVTGRYALELRFRNMSLNDAMVKAEYYIMENLE